MVHCSAIYSIGSKGGSTLTPPNPFSAATKGKACPQMCFTRAFETPEHAQAMEDAHPLQAMNAM